MCKVYPPPNNRIKITLIYYKQGYDSIPLLNNAAVSALEIKVIFKGMIWKNATTAQDYLFYTQAAYSTGDTE